MNSFERNCLFSAFMGLCGWFAGLELAWAHENHDPIDRAKFESGVETDAKPWTHLDFRNDPYDFQFAIVSDRTGGPRKGVFEDAVEKLNWMQPEFVMSVGDLIQGTSENAITNAAEWDEMLGWIEKLEMPFFFAAGNHDIQAKSVPGRVSYEVMRKQWEDRFGTTYYYYKYKDVLFIALFSNDGIERHISDEQVAYFQKVLSDNQNVRWTMVFLHHPLWDSPHESNFSDIEAALDGREYTVFAGHQHMYRHFERKNTNYYVLATTGGGSGLRGNEFGEFDHITWVTMTDEGPRLANIRLDGILPHDVTSGDVKEYSMLLTMSASIDAVTLLEENEYVEAGMAYLTFNNRSPFPIEYKGTFFHNHYAHPTPGKVKVTVPPRSSETVAVSLQTLEEFRSSDKVRLEFEGSVAFASDDAPAIEMSGRQAIRLATTKIDLIEQESIAFTDSTQLRMAFAPEGVDVRYTLDGSEPDEYSLRYAGPLTLESGGLLKARLFSDNGVKSDVDAVQLEKIERGQGLLCDYYEYKGNPAFGYVLPDFSTIEPTLTKRVSEIDPERDSRRDESYGLVYRGYIDLPESGEYLFHLTSDDGARLIIDDKTVIDDPSKHPIREVSGSAVLSKGKHRFELQHFQHKQRVRIELAYTLPSGMRMEAPAAGYSY